MAITHKKVSAKSDGSDSELVRPSDWNDDHEGTATPDAHKASHQNAGSDEVSVTGLSGLLADDQHVLDAEALAAAVQAGAITNAVVKAPTHDAVFDVKATADAAQPAATDAAVAETVYYQPIFVEEDTTYIRVAIEVTVGAVGSAEIWLYTWNDGLPDAKIADLGTIASTNTVQVEELTISQALEGGKYYFLAIRFTATPTCTVANDSSTLHSPISGSGTAAAGFYLNKVILTVASATLTDPATAPTGGSDVERLFMIMREN